MKGVLIYDKIYVQNLSLFDFGQIGKGTLSRTKPVGTTHEYLRPYKKQKLEFPSFSSLNRIIMNLTHVFLSRYHKCISTCCKNIQIAEELILSAQEGLYLSTMGILTVEYNGISMKSQDLWNHFCKCQGVEYFASRYVAYLYYKDQGWIVKSGIKYGCDFVLYAKEIERSHAEFCVLICQDDIKWLDLHRQVRLTSTIAKTLKVCRIYFPQNLDWTSIENSRVWDISVKRKEFET